MCGDRKVGCHIISIYSSEVIAYVLSEWWWWWRLIPRRQGLLGKLMVNSCTLVGGCRDRFLMRTPYSTLDRRRFGMRMIGMLTERASSIPSVWAGMLKREEKVNRPWPLWINLIICVSQHSSEFVGTRRLCYKAAMIVFTESRHWQRLQSYRKRAVAKDWVTHSFWEWAVIKNRSSMHHPTQKVDTGTVQGHALVPKTQSNYYNQIKKTSETKLTAC